MIGPKGIFAPLGYTYSLQSHPGSLLPLGQLCEVKMHILHKVSSTKAES